MFLRLAIILTVMGAMLFGGAGRWDWWAAWAYLGVFAVSIMTVVRTIDPALLKERLRPAPGGLDRHMRWMITPFYAAHLVVAALDVGRFHWSDDVPAWLQAVSLLAWMASGALSIGSMRVNRFFSPVVRIQSERGHHLVTDGPYRWVRHPGYVAALGFFVFSGMILGSWYSLVPMSAGVAMILRRTRLEDRFLHENLPGYRGYAERVRYRLAPFVW